MFRNFLTNCLVVLSFLAPVAPSTFAQNKAGSKPELRGATRTDSGREARTQAMIASAVRHELVTLPYYDVFDWIEAELQADGKLILRGEVVRPTTRTDAEVRVRKIESVTEVMNDIKVLPLFSTDDALRIALYRAIYNWNSPLFRYATRAMPPIHIIVNNGRATLKGVVASKTDSQLAYTAARQVSGLFDVRNELQVEN